MKGLRVEFRHGHVYNPKTGKRLLIKEGATYILLSEQDNDDFEPITIQKPELKSAMKLLRALLAEEGFTHARKIRVAGDCLYFFIRHKEKDERGREKEVKRATFTIRLLEDLYVYRKKTASSKLLKNDNSDEDTYEGVLYDCACVVESSQNDEMAFFESVYSPSINMAYTKTYIYYFGHLGSSSGRDVFGNIYVKNEKEKSNLLQEFRLLTNQDKITNLTVK